MTAVEHAAGEELRALRAKHARAGAAADIAYWTIRDAIRTGVIRGGDRLIELELAAALDMSRTPIRDALRRLAVERLIEAGAGRGYVVATVTLDELIELFEIRGVLEGLAARRAAERMGPAELAALRDTVERMEVSLAADDLSTLSAASHLFHRLIRSGSKYDRLPALLSLLNDSFGAVNAHELAPQRAAAAVGEHRAIFEAIHARDADAAERLAREHAQHALQAQILAQHLGDHGRLAGSGG